MEDTNDKIGLVDEVDSLLMPEESVVAAVEEETQAMNQSVKAPPLKVGRVDKVPETLGKKRIFFYSGLTLLLFIALSAITLWLLPRYKASNDINEISTIYVAFGLLEKNFIADTDAVMRAPADIKKNIDEITRLINRYEDKNTVFASVATEWTKLKDSLLAQQGSVGLLKVLPQLDYRTTEELKTLNKLFVDLSYDLTQKKTVSLETIRAIDLLAARAQHLDANIMRLLNVDNQSQLGAVASLTENLNLIQAGINELIAGNPSLGIQGLKGQLEEEVLNEAQLVFGYLVNNVSAFVGNAREITELKSVQKSIAVQKETIQALLHATILQSYKDQVVTTEKISLSTIVLGMLLVASISLFVLLLFILKDRLMISKFEIYTEKERSDRHEQALLQMIDDMEVLARGDMSVRLEVTDDTTGVLADSFNIVVENLSTMLGAMKSVASEINAIVERDQAHTSDNVLAVIDYNKEIMTVKDKIKVFEENIHLGHRHIGHVSKQSKLLVQMYAYFEQALEHDGSLLERAMGQADSEQSLLHLKDTMVKQKVYFNKHHTSFVSFEQLIASLNNVFAKMVEDNVAISTTLGKIYHESSYIFNEVATLDQQLSRLQQLSKKLRYTVSKFNIARADHASTNIDFE